MKLNALQIREATGGQFLVEPIDTTVFAVSATLDSREVKSGSMFVAMKGENVDGSRFISSAIDKHASVVICENDLDVEVCNKASKAKASIVKVKNCEKALQDIAKYWRKLIRAKVIAITGSTGKTTTRNLIYDVLSYRFNCCVAKKNHNNELGLPLTLCACEEDANFLITEMGMYARGDIELLCNIALPEWGLITNIGECHIERLGSKDNIAKAKTELAENVSEKIGKMFLPAEDEYLDFIINRAKLKERGIEIVLYGGNAYIDNYNFPQLWYSDLELDDKACASFKLNFKLNNEANTKTVKCKLQIPGKHNVINSCGAGAIGISAGLSLEECSEALSESSTQSGRQDIQISKFGYTIINDAYNANPQSMSASLEMFSNMKTDTKKVLCLGDMAELGDISIKEHKKIGILTVQLRFDRLLCFGKYAYYIFDAAKNAGMNKNKLVYFEDKDKLYEYLRDNIGENNTVLIKASNCMGFQELAQKLV